MYKTEVKRIDTFDWIGVILKDDEVIYETEKYKLKTLAKYIAEEIKEELENEQLNTN